MFLAPVGVQAPALELAWPKDALGWGAVRFIYGQVSHQFVLCACPKYLLPVLNSS